MENFINALIITVMILALAYFALIIFGEIIIHREIKRKISEAVVEIMEREDKDEK